MMVTCARSTAGAAVLPAQTCVSRASVINSPDGKIKRKEVLAFMMQISRSFGSELSSRGLI
jgi:hypothetical protein